MHPNTRKHVIQCPQCGADALDHMTRCPQCNAPLKDRGMDVEKLARTSRLIRIITWTLAALLLAIALLKRFI